VDEWIKGKKIAPIFYGNSTIDEIVNQKKKFPPDAYRFIDNFSKINSNAIIFSIGNSKIYIYKQKSILKEYDEFKNIVNGDLVKGIEIELINEIEIKKCPLVLITIKSNRYMSSGAFRKIDELKGKSYFGNVKALEYFLYNSKPEIKSFEDYLFCLSSLEFETLIAKIYEEKHFYVPAYKGGFIKNFDLFCKKEDNILSLQIKLNLKKEHYNEYTDLYYCINSEIKKDNIRTWKEIENEIKKCSETIKWLRQTLDWWVNYKGEL
jgi:hypothetical protein